MMEDSGPLFSDQVLPEEQNFGIASAGIERWHMIVQYTFYYGAALILRKLLLEFQVQPFIAGVTFYRSLHKSLFSKITCAIC